MGLSPQAKFQRNPSSRFRGTEKGPHLYVRTYRLGWSGLYNFFENARSHPLYDAFIKADHDELMKIYIFPKHLPPRPHLFSKNNMVGQEIKM